jgi:hypothetical protein
MQSATKVTADLLEAYKPRNWTARPETKIIRPARAWE